MQVSTLEGLRAEALTRIAISGRHFLSLHSLLPLARCRALQRISVTWTSFHVRPRITRTSSAHLLQALAPLTALTELKLCGSSGPQRASPDRLRSLTRLLEKLPGATAPRRRQLMVLGPGLRPAAPPLRQLIMAGCQAVRDQDLAALAASPLADHLTLLSLAGCVKLTGRGFDSVASLSYLRRLDLSQCVPQKHLPCGAWLDVVLPSTSLGAQGSGGEPRSLLDHELIMAFVSVSLWSSSWMQMLPSI